MSVEKELLEIYRELAAARLDSKLGWQRYEAKNKECLELRERMAELNTRLLDLEKYPPSNGG